MFKPYTYKEGNSWWAVYVSKFSEGDTAASTDVKKKIVSAIKAYAKTK